MRGRKIRRTIGDVVAIPLGDGKFGYGRVLREPLIAFYNFRSDEIALLDDILRAPVAFVLWVMNYAVPRGVWPVLGNAPLTPDLLDEPLFFKKDAISAALTIYRDSTGQEVPATREECEKLECAAVRDPCHVVDRLNDFSTVDRTNGWAVCAYKLTLGFAKGTLQFTAASRFAREQKPMPTVLRIGRLRFFFFSNEGNESPHIHVKAAEDEAKFWLAPVALASNHGFNGSELTEIERLVEQHQLVFLEAGNEHLG
ncbi:MAG: Imm26 family immunity protein [Isosphaeraceae bacterium]